MARIAEITAGHYRIPLPVALSDSTHGTMTAFELITVRVRDADGEEGVGYTYTDRPQRPCHPRHAGA